MSLSIISKTAKAPVSAPVYGHLVHTDKMELCLRATNSGNFFDLSDQEQTLTPRGIYNGVLDKTGIVTKGSGALGGIVVEGVNLSEMREYTAITVIKIDQLVGSNQALNLWAVGDWSGALQVAGMGLFGRIDFYNGVWTQRLRGSLWGKNTDGTLLNAFREVVLAQQAGVAGVMPNFEHQWMFIVHRISYNPTLTNKWSQSVIVKSMNLQSTVSSSADFSPEARKQLAVAEGKTLPPALIGSVYSRAHEDSTDHTIHIKELRIDSTALTDQQIEDQYQATKKWLKAEGAVDISKWV
ncbi:hypothetical protein G9F31_00755 [Acinetobacter sp. 187]|uniref:hypothetical protein n=1 Tax=Acinetobacter lanii TaxID=2715163 RepID=UPI0014094016|nr:hypothetical protein [Acinetobacter lanii]NHC02314.1 hypothetical protein [Acinetobacter lanii]